MFLKGAVFWFCIENMMQDIAGKERVIELIKNGWIETHWIMWAIVAALVWFS